MYTAGRTGQTSGSVKLTVAAVGLALMGMGGVALAAPKTDPGPPEQAQGNGPAPQAHDPVPAPDAKAKAKGHARQGTSGPAEVSQALPPQAGGNAGTGSGGGQSRQAGARRGAGHHGRPAPGENRGHGPKISKPGKASGCQAARCGGGTPQPGPGGNGGDEQSKPAGGQQGADGELLGGSEGRSDDDRVAPIADPGESGSVLGLNQGGGEEVEAARGSFDGALPFTGFELALLAGVGALLGLAGMRLRRAAA